MSAIVLKESEPFITTQQQYFHISSVINRLIPENMFLVPKILINECQNEKSGKLKKKKKS